MDDKNWYEVRNVEEIASPALLVFPSRIESNIRTMISMIGDVNRLRPHIKTHKMAEIIEMQMAHGISKFKCATIAEAELLGKSKAKDVLLAMQPVGVNIQRYAELLIKFPNTRFSTLVDSEECISSLAKIASQRQIKIDLFLDLNTGMDRTGIVPDEKAQLLFRKIAGDPFLHPRGLHAYDGHIRHEDFEERKKVCDATFQKVVNLKNALEKEGLKVETIVAGGSPSFPIHAKREEVEASPGTTLLWDERYGSSFKEMNFLAAAVLLTRIVSKPRENLLCLDLGHKAIAPEMNFPRVRIFGLEESEQIGQSEEHLVLRYPKADHRSVGEHFYAVPMHICPTVAKYPEVLTVSKGEVKERWKVAARDHRINI